MFPAPAVPPPGLRTHMSPPEPVPKEILRRCSGLPPVLRWKLSTGQFPGRYEPQNASGSAGSEPVRLSSRPERSGAERSPCSGSGSEGDSSTSLRMTTWGLVSSGLAGSEPVRLSSRPERSGAERSPCSGSDSEGDSSTLLGAAARSSLETVHWTVSRALRTSECPPVGRVRSLPG